MIKDIQDIIKIFETANVSKLSLEIDNMKLELEKPTTGVVTTSTPLIINNQNDTLEKVDNNKYITAPVVGTFYASRSPEKPPFVVVGQKVKKGDVLCIIEAMKVMNEVTSPYDGVVKEILVANEGIVEFGQKLIAIGETND